MRHARQVLVFVFAFVTVLSAFLVPSALAPVTLAGNPITFTATPNAVLTATPSIHLVWTAGDEIGTAGYNLYRSEQRDGPYIKLNTNLIPVSTEVIVGSHHTYEDTAVKPGQVYYYQLDVLDLNGKSRQQGPFVVTVPSKSETDEKSIPSIALGLFAVLAGGALAGLRHIALG